MQRLKQERKDAQDAARDANKLRKGDQLALRRAQEQDRAAREQRAAAERLRAQRAQEAAEEAVRKADEEIDQLDGELLALQRETEQAAEATRAAEEELERLQDELRESEQKSEETEAAIKRLLEEQSALEEAIAEGLKEIEVAAAEARKAHLEQLHSEWAQVGALSKLLPTHHEFSDAEKKAWGRAFKGPYLASDVANVQRVIAECRARIVELSDMGRRYAEIVNGTQALPDTGPTMTGRKNMDQRIADYLAALPKLAPAELKRQLDTMEQKLVQYAAATQGPTQADRDAERLARAVTQLEAVEGPNWTGMVQNVRKLEGGRLTNAKRMAMDLPVPLRAAFNAMRVNQTVSINGRTYTLSNSTSGGLALHTSLPANIKGGTTGTGTVRKSFIIHFR